MGTLYYRYHIEEALPIGDKVCVSIYALAHDPWVPMISDDVSSTNAHR